MSDLIRVQQVLDALVRGQLDVLTTLDVSVLNDAQRFRAVHAGFFNAQVVRYLVDQQWPEIMDNMCFWVMRSLKIHPFEITQLLANASQESLCEAL